MRIYLSALLVGMTVTAFALGQGSAPVGQENLDTVLRGWEKSMTDLKSFIVEIDRTTTDKVLSSKDVYIGYALFAKSATKGEGSRARMELYKNGDPKSNIFEKYVCTGTFLYEYAPATQKVRVHDMPQNKPGGEQQESFLSFLFGMGAAQAKTRYQMEHVVPKTGPDKNYHYIQIIPKLQQDKTDFTVARLSLYRATNLPAQIWYHQPNGNEITWNFKNVRVDEPIQVKYFDPAVPQGWTLERVPPAGAAKLTPTIRNQSK